MADSWQFIPVYAGTGIEQMAIDNWLLNQHVRGDQPPCLRFYTWRSPTISLGYHQKQIPDHWNCLEYEEKSVELVRRPTGGRAVLHQGDLTYSLVTSGLRGSRREVYQYLCQFLIKGWQKLDVALAFGAAGKGYIKSPNCFGTATAADLVTSDGYKLIGSAQVYREGCVLQHGSIRLSPDAALFETVFGSDSFGRSHLQQRLTALDIGTVVNVLAEAAKESFNVKLKQKALTPVEIKKAVETHQIALER